MKSALIKIILFCTSVIMGLMLGLQNAHAEEDTKPVYTTVKSFYVKGLANFIGKDEKDKKYLTVFYTLGQPPGIMTSTSQFIVRKIYDSKQYLIDKNIILIEPRTIMKDYVFIPNYIMLVIHKDKNFIWKNQNNFPVDDRRALPDDLQMQDQSSDAFAVGLLLVSEVNKSDLSKIPVFEFSSNQ